MSRLDEILRVKRDEIERLRPRRDELHKAAVLRNDFRSFEASLQRGPGQLALIAEVKKASPSAGVIVESFEPVAIAMNFARAGADAISILTDEKFFQGHLSYLSSIREVVAAPLLRKDFILEEIQIAQSAAAGADAILLIVAALEQEKLVALLEAAETYQLDALVEVHTLAEMDRALQTSARIIGINNRDLGTFEVDLSVTEKLSEEVPEEIVLVSESGIRTAEDLERIRACGVDAVLIGEALMRGQNRLIENLNGEKKAERPNLLRKNGSGGQAPN